jgi:hypothetical protein
MLQTRWSAEAWSQVSVEFRKALALRSFTLQLAEAYLTRPLFRHIVRASSDSHVIRRDRLMGPCWEQAWQRCECL